MITRDNKIQLVGNFEQGKEYEVVVAARNKSGNTRAYEDSPKATVYVAGKQEGPAPVTALSVMGGVQKLALSWINPGDYDFNHVEVWAGSVDARQAAVRVGTVRGDSWIHEIGFGGQTRYYWVRAVNSSGQKSAFHPNSVTGGVVGVTTEVQASEIENFAVTASKLFVKVPVLDGDTWTDNSPGAGSVAWNSHSLVYNGQINTIVAGDSSNRFIWWDLGESATTYQTGSDAPAMEDDRFIIAMNNVGSHNVAWNSIANQVIGSAYILDAAVVTAKIDNLAVIEGKIADLAVTDAKISSLTASKLTAGTIDAGVITVTNISASNVTAGKLESVDGNTYLDLDNNTFALGVGGGTGIANFSDAGPLVAVTNIDGVPDGATYARVKGTYLTAGQIKLVDGLGDLDDITNGTTFGKVAVTDISAGHIIMASVDGDLDDVADGGTYKRTNAVEKTGASRAYSAIDASLALVTAVHPATSVATPAGAGLFLGSDYMGYYSGAVWKTYMDNSGNFYLGGASGPLQWAEASSSLTIGTAASGQRCVLSGADNRLEFYDSTGTLRIVIDENVTYDSFFQITDAGGGYSRLTSHNLVLSGYLQANSGVQAVGKSTGFDPLTVTGSLSAGTFQTVFNVDNNGNITANKNSFGAAGHRSFYLTDIDIVMGGGGLVDSVDVAAFKSTYDSHAGSASAHHAKTTISDTAYDGQTTIGISSNWAYDHKDAESGTAHQEAATDKAGFMSAADKTSMDNGVTGSFIERELKQRADSKIVYEREKTITVTNGLITAIGAFGAWGIITQEVP